MSNLTINERFTLDADPEIVWGYLIDPERIVRCLPGAEFLGQEGENTYAGAVKVKVGAVSMSYKGKAVFEEVDHEARFVRIVGRGREKSGSGTATMTMESRVVATDSGGAEVTVEAQVKLAGKIVRFGRGMIETISAEIFKEFTVRLADVIARDLAKSAGQSDEGMDASGPATGESAPGPPPTGPAQEGSATPMESSGPDTSNGDTSGGVTGGGEAGEGEAGGRDTGVEDDGRDEDNSIALIPLLFRAFKRRIGRLFGGD